MQRTVRNKKSPVFQAAAMGLVNSSGWLTRGGTSLPSPRGSFFLSFLPMDLEAGSPATALPLPAPGPYGLHTGPVLPPVDKRRTEDFNDTRRSLPCTPRASAPPWTKGGGVREGTPGGPDFPIQTALGSTSHCWKRPCSGSRGQAWDTGTLDGAAAAGYSGRLGFHPDTHPDSSPSEPCVPLFRPRWSQCPPRKTGRGTLNLGPARLSGAS